MENEIVLSEENGAGRIYFISGIKEVKNIIDIQFKNGRGKDRAKKQESQGKS